MLLLSIVTVLSLSMASIFTAFADEADYAVGTMTTVPVYAEGAEDNMRTEVTKASKDLGAATGAFSAVVEDFDRILLAQSFAGGAVFMNEVAGRAFAVTDEGLLTAWLNNGEPKGVILTEVLEKMVQNTFLPILRHL